MRTHFLRKTVALLVLLFSSLVQSAFSTIPNLDIIDTPTAMTLPRANYNVSLWAYGQGGILTKAIMGLHDNIFLGVSFDVENAIGSGPVGFNVPGVAARIKLTDGWQEFPLLISIGYDFFYSGSSEKIQDPNGNPFMRNIYGSYLVFSKPVFMFGAEQHFHFGVRLPLQPNYQPENTEVFGGFDFAIGYFVPMIEVEKIYFDKNRFGEILANIGFRFLLGDTMSIEINLMFNKNLPVDRMLVFEFMDNF